MVAFATQVKRRRGTTAQNDAFTGAEGEIVVDTQRHELRVHDGRTRGGFTIPTTESMDYVVESQLPTAENGYTWYRKYKSGWVEQGGVMTWDLNNNNGWITNSVSFPQIMQDTSYTPIFSIEEFPGLEQEITVSSDVKNTSSLIAGMYREHPQAITNPVYIYWIVVGMGQI